MVCGLESQPGKLVCERTYWSSPMKIGLSHEATNPEPLSPEL
jgi:hypothetical protein